MILVDSNILIDIMGGDPAWSEWSKAQVRRAASGAYLFVNPVVAGEIGWQFESVDHFQLAMTGLLIGIEPLDATAGFLASKAYHLYRKRRGTDAARIPLADFFMGGHAQAAGATILTRDPRFYRSYFSDVPLITPETTS